MFEFSFGESITKEFILSKLTEESIFCYYLGIPQVSKKLIRSKLRKDKNPTCGFYRNKAKNIIACSKKILSDFDGKVPQNMEDLISLPGVGRKSANVIMLEAFGIPCGVAVDTHAKRLSNRIGLSTNSEPEKIEQDLMKIFPKERWTELSHQLVLFGRYFCIAKKPKCNECKIFPYCPAGNKLVK